MHEASFDEWYRRWFEDYCFGVDLEFNNFLWDGNILSFSRICNVYRYIFQYRMRLVDKRSSLHVFYMI